MGEGRGVGRKTGVGGGGTMATNPLNGDYTQRFLLLARHANLERFLAFPALGQGRSFSGPQGYVSEFGSSERSLARAVQDLPSLQRNMDLNIIIIGYFDSSIVRNFRKLINVYESRMQSAYFSSINTGM